MLASDRPDAFLPDLAASLNNLGCMLGGLGRRQEARAAAAEAVSVYRMLSSACPDVFLSYLAGSLNNLGTQLSVLGRRAEALAAAAEAVSAYRSLSSARPDVFLPNLAVSLNNMGNRLAELGRLEEAVAAAGRGRVDSGPVLPSFARCVRVSDVDDSGQLPRTLQVAGAPARHPTPFPNPRRPQ